MSDDCILKSVYTPHWGNPDLYCRCVRVCVSFAFFEVVCNELSDGVRYVGVYEFVDKFTHIHFKKTSSCQELE